MAPAEGGGVGEQQDGHGDELGAETAESRRERPAHQRIVLHACEDSAALEVYHAGGQDDEGCQGADHHGIGEDLKHAPHALMHRLLDVGGRVDHDRRAEAGFVGERAALEAPGDGLADAVAQRAAACSVEVECTLEDRRQCRRDIARVHDHDDERTCNIEQCHQRHQLFRDSGHPLESADDDEGRHRHQRKAGGEVWQMEGRVHVAGNGVYLAHVADPERREDAEAGKQDSQHPAHRPTAGLCTQTVGQIIHRAAVPLAFFVLAAVVDAQHVLRKAGHHAQKGHDPHPEDGARAAGDDGRGHAHDVAGADGACQCRTHALELADGHVFLAGVGGDVLIGKNSTNGMLEPVAHPPELEKAGADAEPQAGAEQQCQTERPPDEAVDHIVDARDDVHHMKSPSDHPKQKCGQNLFSKGSARKKLSV